MGLIIISEIGSECCRSKGDCALLALRVDFRYVRNIKEVAMIVEPTLAFSVYKLRVFVVHRRDQVWIIVHRFISRELRSIMGVPRSRILPEAKDPVLID